ncbi:MAG: hypothetical protein JWM04_1093 [Verrucomicrobiales bacterium]|nr:hypothetical protein [Verrucomicrobiales bacterium]
MLKFYNNTIMAFRINGQLIAFLFFGLISFCAVAVDKPAPRMATAFYDFEGDETSSNYALKISSLASASLSAETNFVILERSKINRLPEERSIISSGKISPEAAAKIGKVIGAKVLISGFVRLVDSTRLTIDATVIATATGQGFPVHLEGPVEKMLELSSGLGTKIAQTINKEKTSFSPDLTPRDDRLKRIVQASGNVNLPTVSISIYFADTRNRKQGQVSTVEMALSSLLVHAGFTVLDDKFKGTSDLEIVGYSGVLSEQKGNLFTTTATLDVKVQHRKTGKIIIAERTRQTVSSPDQLASERGARARSADEMADKIVPIMVGPLP